MPDTMRSHCRGSESTSEQVVLELRLEDGEDSFGWSWVDTEHPLGMLMSNSDKGSRAGKDRVAEQLEKGEDGAEWGEM